MNASHAGSSLSSIPDRTTHCDAHSKSNTIPNECWLNLTVSDENRTLKYVDFVAWLRTTEFRDLSENKNSISSPCFRSSSVSAFNYC